MRAPCAPPARPLRAPCAPHRAPGGPLRAPSAGTEGAQGGAQGARRGRAGGAQGARRGRAGVESLQIQTNLMPTTASIDAQTHRSNRSPSTRHVDRMGTTGCLRTLVGLRCQGLVQSAPAH